MISKEARKALWKLNGAALASASLFAFFIFDRESPFSGLAIGLVVLVLFPSTLLFAIDTSRVIRREARSNAAPMSVLGNVLGTFQLLFGAVLMAFGVVYPVYIFIKGLGSTPLITVLYVGYALVMFSVGFYYTKEGWWLVGVDRTHREKK